MRAIFIQQDAIAELYRAITDCPLETTRLKKWHEIRELRNICAGHPAKKDRPKGSPLTRTFMGRNFGNYESLSYEKWQSPDSVTNQEVELKKLINEYENEATDVLKLIHKHMKRQWKL